MIRNKIIILNSVVDMLVESHILIDHYQFDFRFDRFENYESIGSSKRLADTEGEEVIDGSRVCCSELSLLGSSNERISNFIV